MEKEIVKIKKNGVLIALTNRWQYWWYMGKVYSISVTGTNCMVWCCTENLESRLKKLYELTGRKFFTENPSMTVVNDKYIREYKYA